MANSQPNVTALVDQMPDADRPGQESKFTGPTPEAAAKVFEAILAGGRPALLELIGLIREPTDAEFKNFKPEYVLHGLAIYVGRPGQQAQQELFARTLASQISNRTLALAVRGFLIRELQVAGNGDVVPALRQALADEDLCADAAAALVAIGDAAAPALREALPKARGKCRSTIVQNLGVLQDQASLPALRQATGEEDTEVQLAAGWALATLGDAGSVDRLLAAADREPGFARIAATKSCLVLAEKLLAGGKKAEATKIYAHLRNTRTDPQEHYIRDLAAKALAGMGGRFL